VNFLKLKKLLVVTIITIVALYFGAQYLGLVGGSIQQLKVLDSRYALSAEKLSPATIAEINEYSIELNKLQGANESETSLIETKKKLNLMQKELLSYSSHMQGIDFKNPDCRLNGSIKSAENNAKTALIHSKKAITTAKKITGLSFKYLQDKTFEETMETVIEMLENSINTLKTIC